MFAEAIQETMKKKAEPVKRPDTKLQTGYGHQAIQIADLRPVGSLTAKRLQRAADIVQAARQIFLESGFHEASVAAVAAKVGVVEGLVYAYYPTKRDLLNEVLQTMYRPLLRELEERFERVHGLRSRLRFLIRRHLQVYVDEPMLSRLVLHEVRVSPEYFGSVLHDLQVRYTGFIVRALSEAIGTGELSADVDLELVRSMVYGGIEHRMWAILHGRGSVDIEAVSESFTEMVLRAVGSRVEPSMNGSDVETAQVLERLDRLERMVAGADASKPRSHPG